MWATHSQVNGCHLKISVEGDRREDSIMFPKHLAFQNMSLDIGPGVRHQSGLLWYHKRERNKANPIENSNTTPTPLLPSLYLCIHITLWYWRAIPLLLWIPITQKIIPETQLIHSMVQTLATCSSTSFTYLEWVYHILQNSKIWGRNLWVFAVVLSCRSPFSGSIFVKPSGQVSYSLSHP